METIPSNIVRSKTERANKVANLPPFYKTKSIRRTVIMHIYNMKSLSSVCCNVSKKNQLIEASRDESDNLQETLKCIILVDIFTNLERTTTHREES